MGTRSLIGLDNGDGTITSVYCHWDGYPEGVGATLLRAYDDEVKVRALLAAGDHSSLGDDPTEGAYNDGSNAVTSKRWGNAGQEFEYLYRGGVWQFRPKTTGARFRNLAKAI